VVLTDSGQTLHFKVMIDIGQIVEREVLKGSGQPKCEVLTDNGQSVQ